MHAAMEMEEMREGRNIGDEEPNDAKGGGVTFRMFKTWWEDRCGGCPPPAAHQGKAGFFALQQCHSSDPCCSNAGPLLVRAVFKRSEPSQPAGGGGGGGHRAPALHHWLVGGGFAGTSTGRIG